MSVIKRIYQFLEQKGISVNKFSTEIGVSNGYFAKQRSKNASVGSHIIEKIVNTYPTINAEWLITGKGKMLKDEKMDDIAEPELSYGNERVEYLIDKLIEKDKFIESLKTRIDKLEQDANKKTG